MHLPRELLDEILSHLPSDNGRSLRNCSLVSKLWQEPSQSLLFAHVHVHINAYQSWLDNISPTNTRLLCNVRTLEYFRLRTIKFLHGNQSSDPRCRVGAFRDYFPSLPRLRALILRNVIIDPDQSETFSTFQHALSSLSMTQVSFSWSHFVALVGHLPHLRNLEICKISLLTNNEPVSQIPHPLRGRLLLDVESPPFVDQFIELRQEYEEIVMPGTYTYCVAAANQETLKSFTASRYRHGPTSDLSRFRELRQLTITSLIVSEDVLALVSSISSRSFRKVIFAWQGNCRYNLEIFMSDEGWELFDDTICSLVGRLRALGIGHTIEAEFRWGLDDFGEEERHKKFLPKFKEKGRVRIVSLGTGEVREWP